LFFVWVAARKHNPPRFPASDFLIFVFKNLIRRFG